jgi:hypothetical protein
MCYHLSLLQVDVHFTGGMFGSFVQWIAFDFGSRPVLLRKLNVELGHRTVHEQVSLLHLPIVLSVIFSGTL